MEKFSSTLIVLLAIAAIAQSTAQSLGLTHGSISVEDLLTATPVTTQIQFYFQNTASGPNATSYRIANSSITDTSPTMFGFLDMNDDLLTEGPDRNSTAIGRAQGLFGSADLNTLGFFVEFNVYFTSGPYNGSTLLIVGRNDPFSSYQELSVVGGTECFRLATGVVTLRTIYELGTSETVTIQFNVTVFHPLIIL